VNSRVTAFSVVRRASTRALYRSVGALSAVNALGDVAVTLDPYPYLYEAELAVSWVTAGKRLTTTSAKRPQRKTFRSEMRPPLTLILVPTSFATTLKEMNLHAGLALHTPETSFSGKLL
jgi:hypothetical protein